ncbi:MAG: SUMF1/EgtB/PvdO family nonheme iron enzyme [Bacteroidales bacterium]|nr:SUMF1/EgtB/PvdO family nonheme iron enzyme [Bacteroidales bacterium]
MKRTLFIVLLAMVFAGCSRLGPGRDRGHLTGVQNRPTAVYTTPPGMVLIPAGSFTMGPSDQDIAYAHDATSRRISMSAFYMDETEITNNQYRQFVEWVRDSIARKRLAMEAMAIPDLERYGILEDAEGFPLDEPLIRWPHQGGPRRINWNGEEEREILEDMFLRQEERFFHRREIDSRKLIYVYYDIDLQRAARDRDVSRQDLVIRGEQPVYPDTLVWIRDFTYSYNEPLTEMYFWHPTYDHYPVVGVNWHQARAFNMWRTNYLNSYLARSDAPFAHKFELPSEAQWEYAARGGLELNPYPWGGPYLSDAECCFLANFKPQRGNYTATGALHPTIVGHYPPNDYGLYDMAGNVAEWTRTAYDESTYYIMPDFNPDYQYNASPDDPSSLKRKVVRGGSWKDIGYFLQVSTRSYEFQDTATSFIGFRSVQTFPGYGPEDRRRGSSNIY